MPRIPLQGPHAAAYLARAAPVRRRARVDVPARLVVVRERVAVGAARAVEDARLRGALVVPTHAGAGVVRDAVLHAVPDALDDVELAGVRPVPVGAVDPECGPGSVAVGEVHGVEDEQAVVEGLLRRDAGGGAQSVAAVRVLGVDGEAWGGEVSVVVVVMMRRGVPA